jgi:hypothetical protein
LLRSLQKIQPDFVEEAKAGLWSQGEKNKILHYSTRTPGGILYL